MRIAIVNDLPLAIEGMRRAVIANGQDEIAWVARNGEEAVRRCQADRPDLILMDLIMPIMDGVQATRRIMAETPCAIVIVTASSHERTAAVFEAMGAGALDALNTQTFAGFHDGGEPKSLLAKIETIRKLVGPPARRVLSTSDNHQWPGITATCTPLVCFGASAGGPAALAHILGRLPASFPAAIIIAQHVDPLFTAGLADWLGSQTALEVRLATDGDPLQAGVAWVAASEYHLVLTSDQHVGYSRANANSPYKPSVDILFASVAQRRQTATIGVLLTGMGRDGAAGLLSLKQRGFLTIAQDQASSAVFGMPKAAMELQAAEEVLALDKIAPRLMNVLAQRT